MTQNRQHQYYYIYRYHLGSIFTEKKVGGVIDGAVSGLYFSLGIDSNDIANNEWDYLCKKDNKWYENLGFVMGGLANLQDAFAGLNGGEITYKAEYGDVEHARTTGTYTESNRGTQPIEISKAHDPAPAGAYKYSGSNTNLSNLVYARYWISHITDGNYYSDTQPSINLNINNINVRRLSIITDNIKDGVGLWGIGKLKYGTSMFGCQSHVAHALLRVGIPTLPINFHPYILYGQLLLSQVGIYSSLFIFSIY